jgi:putative transposase
VKRLRAYKTKLVLNNVERTWCLRCSGAARWCFNYGLDAMRTAYAAGRKTSVLAEKKRLNAVKDNEAPWLRDLPYTVLQGAFDNLNAAYRNFFRRVKQGNESPGFPKFKSRKNSLQSFNVRGDIRVSDTHVRLPKIGQLRLMEHGYLPTAKRVRILSATVSSQDHGATWYVSLQTEEEISEPKAATGEAIGIDLGIKCLAILSDGTVYENVKPLRQQERKIGRLSRELARRCKGGQNWSKTKAKLTRVHAKARNIRQHELHQISAETVAKRPSAIVMEDLNVNGMMANHCLARAIADLGMYELRRQMSYKAAWNGSQFILADRWYPSSKTCSHCGVIRDELSLAERTFVCPDCGFVIDRDLNAARNLAALA